MKPEYKAPWLAALRSGEYKQGRGRLKREAGVFTRAWYYCCLGVLEDATGVYGNLDCMGLGPNDTEILVRMNDAERQDFNTIADYIEANL